MNEREYKEMIDRIQQMEQLYDRLDAAIRHGQTQIGRDPELMQIRETLCRYYSGGEWQHDYEADEQGLLPQGLKRGVLSQDGLYNLLLELADPGALRS